MQGIGIMLLFPLVENQTFLTGLLGLVVLGAASTIMAIRNRQARAAS